jgi:hypothetical protein
MKVRIIILVLVAILTPAARADNSDGCRDVLELTGREYSVEDQRIAVLVRVHDDYCDGETEKSGTNFQSGAQYLYGISGFLSGANDQETVRNFCKAFDSEYRRNESRYRAISQVVREAVGAWLQCKQLATKGVLFYPDLKVDTFVVGLARTNQHGVKVTGMTYKPNLLSCTVPGSKKGSARIAVDQDLPLDLTDKVWSVTCQRTAVNGIYPQATIAIETDAAPAFTYTIPPDKEYKYQFASDLEKDMATLKDRIAKQEERHYSIKWEDPQEIRCDLIQKPIDAKLDLGKHDVCQLLGEEHQFIDNSSTACLLTESETGWTLSTHHDFHAPDKGSTIVCHAMCGTIQ